MHPFMFMFNELFSILTMVVMEDYRVDNIGDLLTELFETSEKFMKFTDWFMLQNNIDYRMRVLNESASFTIDVKVYNLMKLYHKNFNTRSIAYILRNVMMFALRVVIIEGIDAWEKFRDNVVKLRENFMDKYKKSLRKKFHRIPKNTSPRTFSENIYSPHRVKRHRIATYDEASNFINQIIHA